MQYLLFYSVIGFLCGLFSSAVVYALVGRRWVAYLAALLSPLPILYLIVGFGLAFMRDETMTVNSFANLAAFILALTSLLAARLVCRIRFS